MFLPGLFSCSFPPCRLVYSLLRLTFSGHFLWKHRKIPFPCFMRPVFLSQFPLFSLSRLRTMNRLPVSLLFTDIFHRLIYIPFVKEFILRIPDWPSRLSLVWFTDFPLPIRSFTHNYPYISRIISLTRSIYAAAIRPRRDPDMIFRNPVVHLHSSTTIENPDPRIFWFSCFIHSSTYSMRFKILLIPRCFFSLNKIPSPSFTCYAISFPVARKK